MQNEIHPELLQLLERFKTSKQKLETTQGSAQQFAAQLALASDAIVLSNALERLLELHFDKHENEKPKPKEVEISVSIELNFEHIAREFILSIGKPTFITVEHEGNALLSAVEVAVYTLFGITDEMWSSPRNSLLAEKVLAYAAASLNDAQCVSSDYVERTATRVRHQLRELPPFIYGLMREHKPRFGSTWFDDREHIWAELVEMLSVEPNVSDIRLIKEPLKLIVAGPPSQSFMKELESNFETVEVLELGADRVKTLNSSTVVKVEAFVKDAPLVGCVLGGMKHKLTNVLKSAKGRVRYLDGSLHSAQSFVKEMTDGDI